MKLPEKLRFVFLGRPFVASRQGYAVNKLGGAPDVNKPRGGALFLCAAALFCVVAALGARLLFMPDDGNARMSWEEAMHLQVGSLALLNALMLLAGGLTLWFYLKQHLACWAFCAAVFLFASTPFFYAVSYCQDVLSLTAEPDAEPEDPEL